MSEVAPCAMRGCGGVVPAQGLKRYPPGQQPPPSRLCELCRGIADEGPSVAERLAYERGYLLYSTTELPE